MVSTIGRLGAIAALGVIGYTGLYFAKVNTDAKLVGGLAGAVAISAGVGIVLKNDRRNQNSGSPQSIQFSPGYAGRPRFYVDNSIVYHDDSHNYHDNRRVSIFTPSPQRRVRPGP